MPEAVATQPNRLRFALPSFALPAQLPPDVESLKTLLLAQHQAFDALQAQASRHIEYLYEQFVLLRRRQFGASTEHSPGQAWLFDEVESLAAQPSTEPVDAGTPEPVAVLGEPAKPARGRRAALAPELPRVDIVHALAEAERVCPCGAPMVEIGEEISEQLDIVPMRIQVLRHIRKRYGCPGGERTPVTAALPAQPLPKSNASPDTLAMLLTVKYVDGLPLARFEHVLARAGITVARQTLARWVMGAAGVLQPVHNLLRDALFDGPVVHMDETVVQVLKERDKAPSTNSYMWVQTGGPPGRPVVIYDYDPSRSGEVPKRLLAGYSGYLMTDGYEGYNALVRAERIEHLACMVHARRGFVEAARVQPRGKRGRADQAIALIGKLYRIERECAQAGDAVRLERRQRYSVPALAELRSWLDKTRPVVAPQTALGKALAYLDKYWKRLVRYTERGDLPIGRVEMWRGGRRSGLSVSAPFVWRCPSTLAVAPFPHPPRRTGRADLPHPALFRRIKPSLSSSRVLSAAGISAPTARTGTGRDIGGTPVPACRCAFAARSSDAARCSHDLPREFRPLGYLKVAPRWMES
jgi:transposase